MNLKIEVQRAENIKNKTTKAKDTINNKIIECGGERATNLADVPDKITGMIENYFKIAEGEIKDDIKIVSSDKGEALTVQTKTFSIPLNLAFKPKKVIVHFEKVSFSIYFISESVTDFSLDSEYNISRETGLKLYGDGQNGYVFIKSINEKEIIISTSVQDAYDERGETIFKAPIHWIAIGG